ncbi:hypothetical protein QQP08_017671 [Theobroma cacao]|nr:hypothetical protein QQP08_017671 [Theobroma cacao]
MITTQFENYWSIRRNIRSCGTRNTLEENYVRNRLGTFTNVPESRKSCLESLQQNQKPVLHNRGVTCVPLVSRNRKLPRLRILQVKSADTEQNHKANECFGL